MLISIQKEPHKPNQRGDVDRRKEGVQQVRHLLSISFSVAFDTGFARVNGNTRTIRNYGRKTRTTFLSTK